MAEYPDLPRIGRPRGALAAATQLHHKVAQKFPRASGYCPPQSGTCVWLAPTNSAAPFFIHVWNAWMAARAPQFGTTSSHVYALWQKEEAELLAAARKVGTPQQTLGPDQSLAERGISLVLLLPEGVGAENSKWIDGLTHWACAGVDPLIRCMRVTVLAGRDAQWYLEQVEKQLRRTTPFDFITRPNVLVRWAEHGNKVCSACAEVEATGVSLVAQAAQQLQSSVLALMRDCNRESLLPASALVPCAPYAHTGEFATLLANASSHFFVQVNPPPVLRFGAEYASRQQTDPLTSIDVFVRVRCRTATASDDWHPGVLLAASSERQRALDYCTAHSNCGLTLLSAPQSLHLCLVSATVHHFGPNISLYGLGGRAGEPTSTGGSSVWQTLASIVPVDAELLAGNDVSPCSKDSLRPGVPVLEPFFRTFFGRAVTLYKLMQAQERTDEAATRAARLLPHDALSTTDGTEASKSQSTLPSGDAVGSQEQLLTALRLDMYSTRCTIGDALAYLVVNNGGFHLKSMLMNAASVFGVDAPLARIASHFTENLATTPAIGTRQCQSVDEGRAENRRLQMLCDVVIRVRAHQAPKTAVSACSAEVVRRLVRGLQLTKRGEAVVYRTANRAEKQKAVLSIIEVVHKVVANARPMSLGAIEQCEQNMAALHAQTSPVHKTWTDQLIAGLRATISVIGALDGEEWQRLSLVLAYSESSTTRLHLQHVTGNNLYETINVEGLIFLMHPRIIVLQTSKDKARLSAFG